MVKKYVEIVMKGSFDLIKGFVYGFMEGRGISGDAIFEREHHVRTEPALVSLLRTVHVKEDQVHMIIGEGFYQVLKEAIDGKSHQTDLTIISEKEIKGAQFEISFDVYSKEIADEIKNYFSDLPQNVSLEGYDPEEIVREKEGTSMGYAPLHSYELHGSGILRGPAKSVIDLYDTLDQNELIKLSNIELEF